MPLSRYFLVSAFFWQDYFIAGALTISGDEAISEDQAGNHITTFTHQDVVGSARCAGVHEIDTDTLLNNTCINLYSRKD
jgi:hypothetical protein